MLVHHDGLHLLKPQAQTSPSSLKLLHANTRQRPYCRGECFKFTKRISMGGNSLFLLDTSWPVCPVASAFCSESNSLPGCPSCHHCEMLLPSLKFTLKNFIVQLSYKTTTTAKTCYNVLKYVYSCGGPHKLTRERNYWEVWPCWRKCVTRGGL